MDDQHYYSHKVALSREQTQAAWDMVHSGKTHAEVSERFGVTYQTLYRSYKYYGLPLPRMPKWRQRISNN